MSKTSQTASRQTAQADGAGASPASPRPLPVSNLNDALTEFRRPFAASAVKWKVQRKLADRRGLMVAYVDARLVHERLNLVAGGAWSYTLEEMAGGIKCSLTVFDSTRPDIGKGGFEKASASDAIKRAAVPFGIGASLYATPTRVLAGAKVKRGEDPGFDANDRPRLAIVEDAKGKEQFHITSGCESWLRDQYGLWLMEEGEARFGEPFDHGDAADTVGDAAEGGEGVVLTDLAEDDESAIAERKAGIRAAYEAAVTAGAPKSKMPRRQFEARLNAESSPEDLDELEAAVAEFAEKAIKDEEAAG